jgi:hypothetical protein
MTRTDGLRASVILALVTICSCGSGSPLKAPDGGSSGSSGSGAAGSGGGGAGSGGGGSSAGSSGGGSGGASPCPAQAPADGTACGADLQCEYGVDPNPYCRTLAVCFQQKWQVNPVSSTDCPSKTATTCPASSAAAMDAACTESGAWCTFPPGRSCHCTDCRPGPVGPYCTGSPTWHCPFAPMDCPAVIPPPGTTCSGTAYCDYGCEFGVRRCVSGLWRSEGGNCPQSRRAVKADIHYLSPAEIDRLAAETEAMRLARYRYRSPAFGAPGTHLGFIIDDNPDLPAVSASRETVDLYGFASMLLATSQAQARRIEALEREVARLRKHR